MSIFRVIKLQSVCRCFASERYFFSLAHTYAYFHIFFSHFTIKISAFDFDNDIEGGKRSCVRHFLAVSDASSICSKWMRMFHECLLGHIIIVMMNWWWCCVSTQSDTVGKSRCIRGYDLYRRQDNAWNKVRQHDRERAG